MLAAGPPKKEYEVGEHVLAQGWASKDTGVILEIDWIYHYRPGKYTWGYRIKWDNDGPGLAFIFIPQGYLRKIT